MLKCNIIKIWESINKLNKYNYLFKKSNIHIIKVRKVMLNTNILVSAFVRVFINNFMGWELCNCSPHLSMALVHFPNQIPHTRNSLLHNLPKWRPCKQIFRSHYIRNNTVGFYQTGFSLCLWDSWDRISARE